MRGEIPVGKYFGTDGIRGVVNAGLDAELAFRVGQAAAMVLAETGHERPVFTIGKDTRISGDMLEAALAAGLFTAGADVIRLGVIPTPAVAYITAQSEADAGIVISASHNPFEDNGIKIFNAKGFKLSDELEARIEALLDGEEELKVCRGGEIGRFIDRGGEYAEQYVEHIVSCAEGEIAGLKVIIDCANGAATRTASKIFSRFPISLELIQDHPDGCNINDGCGSTHMELLSRMVTAGGYDIGIAFDGDADRCLVMDERGELVDGDKIMGIIGRDMLQKGKLKGESIVATVMSNLGLHVFAEENGITLHCAAVGDRNVLAKMLEGGYNLGGEQSGHMIFLDDVTTGDGQLTAVKFLSVLCASGKKLSELAAEVPAFPQVLQNIAVEGGNSIKEAIMKNEQLLREIKETEAAIPGQGRVLVRPSGTEALIRVMVEAQTQTLAEQTAEFLTKLIKNHMNP